MGEMSFLADRTEDSSNIQTFVGTLELRSKGGGCSVYCQGHEVHFRARQGNMMFLGWHWYRNNQDSLSHTFGCSLFANEWERGGREVIFIQSKLSLA
jgi:hypothetical protein